MAKTLILVTGKLILVLLLGILTGIGGAIDVQGKDVTVAVVTDGPSTEDALVVEIERELQRVIGDETTITFKHDPAFDAQWDASRLKQVIHNALADREVDLILGVGLLVTQEAAREDLVLTKPFISSYVQRADVPALPYSKDDRSLKENLSLMAIPAGARRDMEALQQIAPFSKLHVGIDALEAEYFADLEMGLDQYGDSLGVEIITFTVTDDVSDLDERLPEDIEAFYLSRMTRLTEDKRRTLINALNDRKVPTFSLHGHSDVELGVLAALIPDLRAQAIRRISLNISQVIRGVSTSDLPVLLAVHPKLFINARTMNAIGYVPSFEIRAYAKFLEADKLESDVPPLTFTQTLDMAQESSVSLSIEGYRVESAMKQKDIARSPLLPQILAGASYQNQKLYPSEPLIPEDAATAGVRLDQMIYDDRSISDFRSSSRIAEASTYEFERERLDVLESAGDAYISYAVSRVLYRIAADNVQLTEENLELSRLRFDVGYSGRDEVYRWEAELAGQRTDLLTQEANVDAARIAMNQVLGIDQSKRWMPEEMEVDADKAYFLRSKIDSIVRASDQHIPFVEYMVVVGIHNAQELETYRKLIEAQEITLGQRKRRWFLPTFVASLYYDYQFDRSPEFSDWEDDSYGLALNAVYPLFEGGNRISDIGKQSAELDALSREYQLAQDLVERRVRTAVSRMESSFPSIKLTRTAAEAATKNLGLVQDKYAQGLVNITDLLEAQNQAFSADQNAAAAVYRFLRDLNQFQRAISWFEYEKTPEERDEFLLMVQNAFVETD